MVGERRTAVRKPITAEIEIQASLTDPAGGQRAPLADGFHEDQTAYEDQ
jgi:hypothetical protein